MTQDKEKKQHQSLFSANIQNEKKIAGGAVDYELSAVFLVCVYKKGPCVRRTASRERCVRGWCLYRIEKRWCA